MPDPLTPAWIASRLTTAQREALLWLPADGSERSFENKHDDEFAELENMDIQDGVIALLVDLSFSGWRAAPLGLRVREVVATHNRSIRRTDNEYRELDADGVSERPDD